MLDIHLFPASYFLVTTFVPSPRCPSWPKPYLGAELKCVIKNIRCSSHAVRSALLDVPDERGGPL